MKTLNKKALTAVEYIVLFVIVIAGFLIMRNYIQRGLNGHWGQSGQSFAFGRQYDSQKSVDCGFDGQSNLWYDRNCFETAMSVEGCSFGQACQENIITGGSCASSSCNQLK